jgi:hypothetical protein
MWRRAVLIRTDVLEERITLIIIDERYTDSFYPEDGRDMFLGNVSSNKTILYIYIYCNFYFCRQERFKGFMFVYIFIHLYA